MNQKKYKKEKKFELLPDVDPDADCQMVDQFGVGDRINSKGEATIKDSDEDHAHDVQWDNLPPLDATQPGIESWIIKRAWWTRFLESISLAIERPANRLIGTAQLNPFYHTGTIATLLLIIVGLTGFFLFLFYQYGFEASYNAVLTRIEEPFIARTIRAIHRYASGALIITTLLHAYRTLFMERFHGPRWLAWVTGVFITAMLWLAGVTGYWLIWDERAQLINDSFIRFLDTFTPLAIPYSQYLLNAQTTGVSWPLFLIIFAVHVLLTIMTAAFFWIHIKRLNRPKWLPPAYWVVGVCVVVLIVAVMFPLGMLPQGDLSAIPREVSIDPLFLFYIPLLENPVLSGLLWGGLLVFTILLASLPWLRIIRKNGVLETHELASMPPVVNIIKDRCTGCTVCALDCPYKAIRMVERTDGQPHKYIAIENPALCTSCGICIGSCDGVAVTMGNVPLELFWQDIAMRMTLARIKYPETPIKIAFTCERHAAQGAKPYLNGNADFPGGTPVEIVTLPCVGAIPPDLLKRALEEGAEEIKVIGCPVDDCTNREGNLWAEQRLVRERVPRLKKAWADAPISAFWLPPDDFAHALAPIKAPKVAKDDKDQTIDYLEQRRINKLLNWRNYLVAFLLLAIVMIIQVLLTDLAIKPYPQFQAMNRVLLTDLAAPIGRSSYLMSKLSPELQLLLEVDGAIILQDTIITRELVEKEPYPFMFEQNITPGEHHIRLTLTDDPNQITFLFFEEVVSIAEDEILTIPRLFDRRNFDFER